MHAFRTRFKKDIVCEFLPSVKKSNKVIIILSGMPGYPGKKEELMEFLSKKGYWVFIPRYRGTWESDGEFLKDSPVKDVIDVMDGIESGFADLYAKNKYKLKTPKFYLIGSSFGGPAAIIASKDKRVKKAIALSPVIDWRVDSEIEPMDMLQDFTRNAFGNAYRFKKNNWQKLTKGNFYNPIDEAHEIDGKKILIIHAKDDVYVPYLPSYEFSITTGAKIMVLKKGGHLSSSILPKFWNKIANFIK